MPYRRLPKTDQARMRALRAAIYRADEASFNDQVVSFATINEAKNFISQFESQVALYHQNTDSRISANKDYRHIVNMARMHISHFIQILNMAVARGEIKAEQKALYNLPIEDSHLPDLSTEESLLYWGKCIIDGEMKRISQPGNIYRLQNPPITVVQVHYEVFKEKQQSHTIRKQVFTRSVDSIAEARQKVDAIILDIWNQVEAYYANCKPYDRLCKCKAYGLIYYYRTGEAQLTAETDKAIEEQEKMMQAIDFDDETENTYIQMRI